MITNIHCHKERENPQLIGAKSRLNSETVNK